MPLRHVIAALERLYPPDTAQSWDQVGLVVGDADQEVRSILVAVDPTAAVIAEAQDRQIDLIITHHPLLLRGVHSITPATAKGSALQTLILEDLALYCAHTNADVAEFGVGHALARACGLRNTSPLTMVEGQELGRVGDLEQAMSLLDFATGLAGALRHTPAGMRISGPGEARIQRVAVLGGAGDDAFEAVRDSGADVYVTADLRHHPASEAREQALLGDGRPYLIDAGHFASEALWLPLLAEHLISALGPLGAELSVHVSSVCTDPWDFWLPTGDS
ncbi:MAG: Nif3-like dinuclear metal center hexameric protein [Ornithinimicrobium sp.]